MILFFFIFCVRMISCKKEFNLLTSYQSFKLPIDYGTTKARIHCYEGENGFQLPVLEVVLYHYNKTNSLDLSSLSIGEKSSSYFELRSISYKTSFYSSKKSLSILFFPIGDTDLSQNFNIFGHFQGQVNFNLNFFGEPYLFIYDFDFLISYCDDAKAVDIYRNPKTLFFSDSSQSAELKTLSQDDNISSFYAKFLLDYALNFQVTHVFLSVFDLISQSIISKELEIGEDFLITDQYSRENVDEQSYILLRINNTLWKDYFFSKLDIRIDYSINGDDDVYSYSYSVSKGESYSFWIMIGVMMISNVFLFLLISTTVIFTSFTCFCFERKHRIISKLIVRETNTNQDI